LTLAGQHPKTAVAGYDRLPENPFELGWPPQAHRAREGVRGHRYALDVDFDSGRAADGASGRQALSTLGATRLDDEPAGPGRHTRAKAVAAGALEAAGLECTLHGLYSCTN